MQDVEHAVRHHHFFTAFARGGNGHFQLVFGHDAKAGIRTPTHRIFQLDWRNGGGSEFTDDHARRGVREVARFFQGVPRRQRRRQHANHRITGTGHVVHFLRLGWHMQRRLARLQQRHALF